MSERKAPETQEGKAWREKVKRKLKDARAIDQYRGTKKEQYEFLGDVLKKDVRDGR